MSLFTGVVKGMNPAHLPPQCMLPLILRFTRRILTYRRTGYVDVADDARLHIAALIDPDCNGKRIFAFAKPFTWNEILAVFREMCPDKKFQEDGAGLKSICEVPNQEAEQLLRKHFGKGWTSLEDSVKENVATLV